MYVCTCTHNHSPGNGTHCMRHLILLKLVRAQKNGVCVAFGQILSTVPRNDAVFVRRKAGQSNRGNLVECQYMKVARFVRLQIAVGLPVAACVLDCNVRKTADAVMDGRCWQR